MKIELDTKYNIGDIVWASGYSMDGDNKPLVRVPVQVKVEQMYLSLHSNKHQWQSTYMVNVYCDKHKCLSFGQYGSDYLDELFDPDDDMHSQVYPVWNDSLFEGEIFDTEKECWDYINDNPFDE